MSKVERAPLSGPFVYEQDVVADGFKGSGRALEGEGGMMDC